MPPAPLILIADDEMDLRAMLRILLERDGYRIVEARNGEEAVALCKQQLPDVVLMDILMPVMDGAAACAHIQALPDGDRVPVLMITALERQAIDRSLLRRRRHRLPHQAHQQSSAAAAGAAFAAHAPGRRGAARQ